MNKRTARAVLLGAAGAAGLALFCSRRGWTPAALHGAIRTACLPGNARRYSLKNVKRLPQSPLAGKHLIFLGSSVTYGAASQGVSFADYLAARHGFSMTKEAVSGTTLTDDGPDSYVARLRRLDRSLPADLFICQLSTNDASQGKPLGELSPSFDPDSFNVHTVAGAMETIVSYVRTVWGCPIVFYTNPRYDSKPYAAMVELLHRLCEKWQITAIDLWSDPRFNASAQGRYALYMADPIHPTKAGYWEWWTPYMETRLCERIE